MNNFVKTVETIMEQGELLQICRNNYGTIYYTLNGERHRRDNYAVMTKNGSRFWYQHGKLHREDGPAVIYYDGLVVYALNGKTLKKNRFLDIQKNKIIYIDGKPYLIDGRPIK